MLQQQSEKATMACRAYTAPLSQSYCKIWVSVLETCSAEESKASMLQEYLLLS